jgi:hypothetical protein
MTRAQLEDAVVIVGLVGIVYLVFFIILSVVLV